MTTLASPPTRAGEDVLTNSGSSAAWTSDDPLIKRAREFVQRGELADAERLLTANSDSTASAEMLDLIGRLRREYSLDEPALIAKLRPAIGDVTPEDLRQWRQAGQVQFRVLDGKVMYFRREPANIFRFCGDAKKRREQHAKAAGAKEDPKPTWTLEAHLAEVIAAAESTGQKEVAPVRHRIKYVVTVVPQDVGARTGSLVRVWLPFPQEYRQQKDVRLISSSPAGAVVAPNCAGEGPMTGAPQRSTYFEQKVTDLSKPMAFEEIFEYTSYAYYPRLRDEDARPLPADFPREYLAERPPHIVFTPELRAKVAEIIGDERNPLAKARKIFHWIDREVAYCAEEEYCLIPSFATKALTCRRGDCGIQTMLFMTMCRAAGVPTRWQSGWETKKIGWNMHDWCEFYVEPRGWLPADPSYGVRKSDDPRVRDFYLGHQDAYRMIVNRDYGRPLCPEKKSLRSEPADFQRGEVEVDGKNVYFDDWDYTIEFQWK